MKPQSKTAEEKDFEYFKSEVAKKYGLGNTLVTGHKATYFNEAAENFASQEVRRVINDLIKDATYIYGEGGSVKSIVISQSKIDKLK